MKRHLIVLTIILSILLAGLTSSCDSSGGFDESDEIAWEQSGESEVYADEYDEIDDDPPPSINEDQLFLRDFTLPLPLFSSNSAWNQRADQAKVLPDSDQQILSLFRVLLGDISSLKGYSEPVTDWPYMDISLYNFTVPIFRSGSEMQEVLICEDEGVIGWAHPKFDIDTEGGPVVVPAPAGTVRPSGPENDGADAHMVLYDSENQIVYDYFAATPNRNEECLEFEGGIIGDKILQAGVVDYFDLQGPGANPDGYYSARAVGTPLLAGLILPEDIESGVIAHALSFAIPGPRNTSFNPSEPKSADYFYPASTTETDFYNTDSLSLASGQRIRIKQTLYNEEGEIINEEELAPITRMYLEALRSYGAYLVDNAGGFTFYAEDVHTAVLDLPDDEINHLIGSPPGTPLPEGMTKWQIVIEKLGNDLEWIPLAVSEGDSEPKPRKAQIEISNFEVVEPAFIP